MDEIKKLLIEKLKETEENANNLSIGMFLLKTHEDVFNDNIDIVAHDMAITPIKRYLMLTGESDGLDIVLKLGGDNIYNDSNFKLFVTFMHRYLTKIKNDEKYEEVEEYKYNENLVYDKFKKLFEKIDICISNI
jgi:hypothetical protein